MKSRHRRSVSRLAISKPQRGKQRRDRAGGVLGQAAACKGDAFLGYRPFDGWGDGWLFIFGCFEDDFALGAVHGDDLSALDAAGGDARAHHSRDAILAGDDAAVAERPADVGDDGGCHGEERRPGGGGGASDEYVAGAHLVEVFGAVQVRRPGR